MRREKDRWVFESGRHKYAYTERLSVVKGEYPYTDWEISYGSDGGFWSPHDDANEFIPPESRLDKADLLELARHQIAKWQEFEQWLSDNGSSSARESQ